MEKASRSIRYKEKESIRFFLGEGNTLELAFLNKLRKLPFMQELEDASTCILRLFNNACYICTLVYDADYAPLERKEYEKIAIDSHDDSLWINYVFPATMALVVCWLEADECKNIWVERGKQNDIEELCKDICESIKEHSKLLGGEKGDFKALISYEHLLPSGFINDGIFQRRCLPEVVEDRSVKGYEIFDSIGFFADVMKNNQNEWLAAFGQGSWLMEEASKATFNFEEKYLEEKLRELWEWLNQKFGDNYEHPNVREEAFNGQTATPCFTSRQMAILMTAVGRITEKDNSPGKTTIGDVVQKIAGYKSKTAGQSMKGTIPKADKETVANVLKEQFPNLAAEVMKL